MELAWCPHACHASNAAAPGEVAVVHVEDLLGDVAGWTRPPQVAVGEAGERVV